MIYIFNQNLRAPPLASLVQAPTPQNLDYHCPGHQAEAATPDGVQEGVPYHEKHVKKQLII